MWQLEKNPLDNFGFGFYYNVEEVSAARTAQRLAQAGYEITARSVRRVYGDIRRLILRFMQSTVYRGLLRGSIEIAEALFIYRGGPERRSMGYWDGETPR